MHDIADIACNFSSDRFDSDLDEVINRAISNNITKFGPEYVKDKKDDSKT